MKNKAINQITASLALAVVLCSQAAAQAVDINIDISDDALADLAVLESVFYASEDGTPLAVDTRRLIHSALGEINIALDDRVTDDNRLLLDDGTTVLVNTADTVNARIKKKALLVVRDCVLFAPPQHLPADPRPASKKRLIPNCRELCVETEASSGAAICNSVPPRAIKKKTL